MRVMVPLKRKSNRAHARLRDAVADLMKCYGMLRLRRGEACLVPWFTFPSRDAGMYILRRNPIRRDEACLAPTPRQHEIASSIRMLALPGSGRGARIHRAGWHRGDQEQTAFSRI